MSARQQLIFATAGVSPRTLTLLLHEIHFRHCCFQHA
jgi:hypothetical protein